MPKPKPFGFPAWKHCRSKVAKKYINSYNRNMLERWWEMDNLRIGDLINTCSGLNGRVVKAKPIYDRIGKKAEVLFDIEFVCEGGECCSVYYCGVEPAKTKEEIEAYCRNIVSYYKDREDTYGFAERYSKIELNEDGTRKRNEN